MPLGLGSALTELAKGNSQEEDCKSSSSVGVFFGFRTGMKAAFRLTALLNDT
jgi:hypothetical protein